MLTNQIEPAYEAGSSKINLKVFVLVDTDVDSRINIPTGSVTRIAYYYRGVSAMWRLVITLGPGVREF